MSDSVPILSKCEYVWKNIKHWTTSWCVKCSWKPQNLRTGNQNYGTEKLTPCLLTDWILLMHTLSVTNTQIRHTTCGRSIMY